MNGCGEAQAMTAPWRFICTRPSLGTGTRANTRRSWHRRAVHRHRVQGFGTEFVWGILEPRFQVGARSRNWPDKWPYCRLRQVAEQAAGVEMVLWGVEWVGGCCGGLLVNIPFLA